MCGERGPMEQARSQETLLLTCVSAAASLCDLGLNAFDGIPWFCFPCDGKSSPQRCEIWTKEKSPLKQALLEFFAPDFAVCISAGQRRFAVGSMLAQRVLRTLFPNVNLMLGMTSLLQRGEVWTSRLALAHLVAHQLCCGPG